MIEAEFYIIVLFATAGLMLMAQGNELMTIYLALEVTSLSLAFLAAWNKRDAIAGQGLKSTEAGIKFFLLSAMSTAVLLYGMALLYGIRARPPHRYLRRVLTGRPAGRAAERSRMLMAGLGFKIAAAPFQLWTPDVYQGAADAGHRLLLGRARKRPASRSSCASSTRALPGISSRVVDAVRRPGAS